MTSLIIVLLLLVVAASTKTFGWRGLYYRLLKRDVETWQRNGWVDAAGAEAILTANRPQGIGNRLVFLVALMGALLMLFSVISFVAANWEEMSRLARFTWLVALLWAVYLIGWRLVANGLPLFAEAAFALGVGLFGANIVLIAQMFHLDGHPPSAVLLWTLGGLATAWLLESRAALVLAFCGATAWTLMEIIGYDALLHWPFLIVWAAATFLAIRMQWWYAYHLALVSLLCFFIPTLIRIGIEAGWAAQGIVASFVMLSLLMLGTALWLHTSEYRDELDRFELWLEKYALIALIASLFLLQTLPQNIDNFIGTRHMDLVDSAIIGGKSAWLWLAGLLALACCMILSRLVQSGQLLARDLLVFIVVILGVMLFALFGSSPAVSKASYDFLSTWIYGTAFLAFLLWLMTFGHRRHADSYVWVALAAFALEVLYIYVSVFGSLMETSLFFFVGGLLTMALAYFLYKLHLRLDQGSTAREVRS